MNFAIRVPRIAAPGMRMSVETVVVQEGAAVKAGDKLLDLCVGSIHASFHSDLDGTVRDLRIGPGDTLIAGRVMLWIESPTPPFLHTSPPYRQLPPASADRYEMRFQLPPELLPACAPIVSRVLVRPGEELKSETPVLELLLPPLRWTWAGRAQGIVAEVLVKPGDELADGTPLLRLSGGATTMPTAQVPLPAPRFELREQTLAEFRRTVEALRPPVEELAVLVDSLGLPKGADLLRTEMVRLGDCRFTVAVVGEFKRGKSTFLNALARESFLPYDVIPCTRFTCRFQYSERLQLVIAQPDGAETISPLSTVPEIIAEIDRLTRDPEASVSEVIVRLPLDLCREGVDLVDTPGLNDSEAMNQVTLSVLPKVDAAALLLIPESPISATERRFLEDHLLASDIGRVVFVLTAKDRVPGPKLGRLVDYIQGQIQQILISRGHKNGSAAPLFCVSSHQELQRPGDSSTGFVELREQLNRLIFRERGRLMLIQMAQRIGRVVSEANSLIQMRIAQRDASREIFVASLHERERRLAAMRLHANELRERVMAAQASAENAAARQARQLYGALLALSESLPPLLTAELLKRGADQVKAELTSLLDQHSGKLHQQAMTTLLAEVRVLYDPAAQAINVFLNQAAQRTVSAMDEPPDILELRPSLPARIDLPLETLSWLYLAESAQSILPAGEVVSSVQARALIKLRGTYRNVIRHQVASRSNEGMLKANLGESVRRAFNGLMHRLDREVQVLLDDSLAALAALRESPSHARGPDSERDWNRTQEQIETAAQRCQQLLFADANLSQGKEVSDHAQS